MAERTIDEAAYDKLPRVSGKSTVPTEKAAKYPSKNWSKMIR